MFELSSILQHDSPFSLRKEEKTDLFETALQDLTSHHYKNCAAYRRILDGLNYRPGRKDRLEDLPFLPVRLFKEFDLVTGDRSQITKTLTSSGTSGQKVSKIYLDAATAVNQTKVLSKILASFLGPKRLPMLILDSKSVLADRSAFSARGAGVLGFSLAGYGLTFVFDENMDLDYEAVSSFCRLHRDETVLLFGFTSIIWERFVLNPDARRRGVDLSKGVLIHGGGWKKLAAQAVDSGAFKKALEEAAGIKRVHNYYGMVEQTGSIFMECEAGYLHASVFSDIMPRDPSFSVCRHHNPGLVELMSLLPTSYPGHVILSEDVGEIIGEDDCPCGRFGKYFAIHGRIQKAELRGCSDTHTS